jgi:hypothetical protein
MGELWGIIQRYLDRHATREAAFARQVGTTSQNLSWWKQNGLRRLPKKDLLAAVARQTGVPYETVLRAALTDAGYLDPVTPAPDGDAPAPATAPGPSPDLSEVHAPRPEDNSGVASRPAHAPSRSRVAGGRGTRPPHRS